MLIVITGGSSSGKSAFAEALAEEYCKDEKQYLATMLAQDEETRRRIERHRMQRGSKGFVTIECPTHLERLELSSTGCVLLECMSNLTANELYDTAGVKRGVVEHILKGIRHLMEQTEVLIVVTNEVFSGYERYEETKRYLHCLGQVNRRLVQEADMFIEVVYGIPIVHKECGTTAGR